MEIEKIRNLTDEELLAAQKQACERLFRLNFQKSLGNQEGIKGLGELKRDISRSKTVARERAIASFRAANPVSTNVAPAKSTRTERKAKRP